MKNKYLFEIQIFGLYEFMLHFLFHITQYEVFKVQMNKCREKRISKYENSKQIDVMKSFMEIYNGRQLDIVNPITFCEKIQWIKVNSLSKIKTDLSDKYIVRSWVTKKIGEKYLIPLIGCWDSFSEIDYASLPQKFCIKTNHGSGMNYVVKDKDNEDYDHIKKIFDVWMENPFYIQSYENQYKDIHRKVIIEEYIEEMDGNLYDYKFHCFNGIPLFIQCIGGRDLKKHTGYQNNYDLNWNKMSWTFEDYPRFPYEVEKPKKLEEMISVASVLAEGFDYVRVDLYEIEDEIKFGEMTFTPASGIYPYKKTWTREMDIELGKLITVC